MLLPWDYGVRNLARRPVRTVLTFLALFIVVLLILVVVGFIRGLEHSLVVSGDPEVTGGASPTPWRTETIARIENFPAPR